MSGRQWSCREMWSGETDKAAAVEPEPASQKTARASRVRARLSESIQGSNVHATGRAEGSLDHEQLRSRAFRPRRVRRYDRIHKSAVGRPEPSERPLLDVAAAPRITGHSCKSRGQTHRGDSASAGRAGGRQNAHVRWESCHCAENRGPGRFGEPRSKDREYIAHGAGQRMSCRPNAREQPVGRDAAMTRHRRRDRRCRWPL
jgi:hypothetical protein